MLSFVDMARLSMKYGSGGLSLRLFHCCSLLGLFLTSVLSTARAQVPSLSGTAMLDAQAKVEGFGERALLKGAPLYFATPAVHLPDGRFDATIGHALFQHSVLLLDFHDMKLWMDE